VKPSKCIFSISLKTVLKNSTDGSIDIRAEAEIGVALPWHKVWQEQDDPGYADGTVVDYAMQTVTSRGLSHVPRNFVPPADKAEEDQLQELGWILSQLGFRGRDIDRAFENIVRRTVQC
jgi:hypothetical protein